MISKNWAEKPFPPGWGNFYYTGSIHFRQFQATLVFVGEKPPPPGWGNFFYTGSIQFRPFWVTLVFVAEKPSPKMRDTFLHWTYPIQAILSNFGFCGRKDPPQDEGNFFTLDLSISGNFKQLWFLWQKSTPPPRWGNFFYTGSTQFQAILSNFGFCGRKAPLPPHGWGTIFFYTGPIQFRQFWATLVFVAGKFPPPWGNFF